MQRGARAEIVFVGKLRKAVPRADQLAVVAAVDAVAEQWAELLRDRAFQLDGQVGDAAPGVYGIGGDDGAGRAGGDAGDAAAALLFLRLVYRQRQIDQQFAEENHDPASRLRISECLPTQPMPALAASARSITGAESTKGRKFNSPQ